MSPTNFHKAMYYANKWHPKSFPSNKFANGKWKLLSRTQPPILEVKHIIHHVSFAPLLANALHKSGTLHHTIEFSLIPTAHESWLY